MSLSREEDKEKTAFAMHKGLFKFDRMPFDLTNVPRRPKTNGHRNSWHELGVHARLFG